MHLVFDGTAAPFVFEPWSLVALLPLGYWLFRRLILRRASHNGLPFIAFILFGIVTGIQLWDIMRIRQMVKSGEGLHVSRGVITNSWLISNRSRDMTRTSLAYKTQTSEGFDLGDERFSWTHGDNYSAATFANSGTPRIDLAIGTPVEVIWFADAATNDQRRIVRLSVGPVPGR